MSNKEIFALRPENSRNSQLYPHNRFNFTAFDTNIGKSMIIQKFLRAHPAREFNADTGLLQVDVLAVEMPPAPQERRLYGQLLMALNAPYRPGDRLAAVEHTA
ncbi:MAG: TniB family NTP-binding protein, partial [Pseudomonadota bacterium]|nr:TniB family NTP-binding protein [Pseudomonadota bacterium]